MRVLILPTKFFSQLLGVYHTTHGTKAILYQLVKHVGISVSEMKYFALCALNQLQTLK